MEGEAERRIPEHIKGFGEFQIQHPRPTCGTVDANRRRLVADEDRPRGHHLRPVHAGGSGRDDPPDQLIADDILVS